MPAKAKEHLRRGKRVGVARVQDAQAGVPVLAKPTRDYRCGVVAVARDSPSCYSSPFFRTVIRTGLIYLGA